MFQQETTIVCFYIYFRLFFYQCSTAIVSLQISPCQLLYTFPIDFNNFTNCIHLTDSPKTHSGSLLDLPGTLPERPWTLQDPLGSVWDIKLCLRNCKQTIIFDKKSAKSNPETPEIWADEVSEPALHVTSPATQQQNATLHTANRAAWRDARHD